MIATILITVSVTLWCLFSFVLYGYHYLLEVILDLPIVGDSPCSAHSALKLIVQKIIREAKDLPKLENEVTDNTLSQENRTYEDLLSTAILNKIISSSQNNLDTRSARSSRANSVCSHRSTPSRRRKLNKEYFFGEETLDNKWKNVDTDTASVSSLEEWVHSDSSLGSTKYVDKVSLTIKHRIEEVPSSESDSDEPDDDDDAEYFRSKNPFENEEPNWFLQKRQFLRGTSSPVPVPMLVPDPTTEAKVLIGDKEIDETSDLSDVPSDFEDGPDDDRAANLGMKTRLLESKSLIGGKNPLADLSVSCQLSDDEISADSGVKECKDFDEVDSEAFSTCNRNESEYAVGESLSSDCSNTERDTEYTEKYATLPRTILVSSKNNRTEDNDNKTEFDTVESDSRENKEFPTGLYSKREKEKWKHAVELKNNPYSKENIEKRIKSRNSFNSQFGSDYYIRQACLPSGAKRTEVQQPKTDHQIDRLKQDIEDSSDEDDDENKTSPQPPTEILEDPQEPTLQLESLQNNTINSEPFFSSEITSDSDTSIVNCYDVKESVIYKKLTANEVEEIQSAEKFLSFESIESSLTNIVEDNNHCSEPKTDPEELKPVAKPRRRMNFNLDAPEKKLHAENSNPKAEQDSTMETTGKIGIEGSDVRLPHFISKRSDNTLIKKIYATPGVRSFALNNRNELPISLAQVNQQQQKDFENVKELKKTSPMTPERIPTVVQFKNYDNIELDESTVGNFIRSDARSKSHSDIDRLGNSEPKVRKNIKRDLDGEAVEEIIELKQKKLVANRLRQFSKSSGCLLRLFEEPSFDDRSSSFEEKNGVNSSQSAENVKRLSGFQNFSRTTSVKDLRKRFEDIIDTESKSDKTILYSLTGRSISKQFKEKLRQLNEDSPSLSQIHSLSLTNLEVEEISRYEDNN